ncbi:MAG: hypothetical protein IAA73_07505 [Bacteroidetes bacterium]|uniref:Uncharacterized protein n=1 Tax=Candidatus Gallipaludibacter merdavium TaxID=2840839 RepID=A0A9D9N4N8_9BACT|nr:hypothetical protein [Candidatus Gallipaludibacter merdavium]
MNTLDFKTDNYGNTKTIEIVNEFPVGYYVWNIGRINFPFEEYIPVVRRSDVPFHIRPETLIAVKTEKELADFILDYAHHKKIGWAEFCDLKEQFINWKKVPVDLINEIKVRFNPSPVYKEAWMNEESYKDMVRKHSENMFDSIICNIASYINVTNDFIKRQIEYKTKSKLIDIFCKSIIEYTSYL